MILTTNNQFIFKDIRVIRFFLDHFIVGTVNWKRYAVLLDTRSHIILSETSTKEPLTRCRVNGSIQ